MEVEEISSSSIRSFRYGYLGGMQLQCFALAVQQILIGIKGILN